MTVSLRPVDDSARPTNSKCQRFCIWHCAMTVAAAIYYFSQAHNNLTPCDDRASQRSAASVSSTHGGHSFKAPSGGADLKTRTYLAAASLMVSLAPALAHTPQQAPHQLFGEGDLKLESGEAIRDFSISYVTHGTLNAAKSNAILMVTAIGGNHHRLDFHDRAGQGARFREVFHRLHRCHCQRPDHVAEQLETAAAHDVSKIRHARHGGIANIV